MGEHIFFEEDFCMKKFTFGMAVFLSASLFFIGCEGPVGPAGTADSSTVPGPAFLEGTKTAADIASLVKAAGASGTLIVPSAGVTLSGGGIFDFGNAHLELVGNLATAGSGTAVEILNLLNANVTFGAGAKINLADANDVALVKAEQVEATGKAGSGAFAVSVANGTDFSQGTYAGNVTAVENYLLSSSATPFGPGSSLKVFVYGTLTVAGDSVLPTAGTITALKAVNLTASNAAALSDNSKVNVSNAKINVTGTAVDVTLDATGAYRFNLGANTLTVSNAAVDVKAEGSGKLVLSGAVTSAAIDAEGAVEFSNATTASAFADGNSVTAGTITFAKGFGTPNAASSNVTLSGRVYVTPGEKITFGGQTGVGTLTLKAGTEVWAAAVSTPSAAAAQLFGVSADTVLTGTTTTQLAIAATGVTQNGVATDDNNSLTVGGILSLAQNWAVLKNGTGTDAFVLKKDAVLKGAGSVVADATTITGGTAGWKVTGTGTEMVTIAQNSITVSAATATLKAQSADSVIEVTAGSLEVTGKIDITTAGKVKLTGAPVSDTDTAGVLVLKADTNAGTLIVDSTKAVATPSALDSATTLTDSTGTSATIVTVTGSGIVVKTATDATLVGTSADLGSIAGASTTNDTTLTGPDDASSEIEAGWKIAGAA
jgi:hypothetical protein